MNGKINSKGIRQSIVCAVLCAIMAFVAALVFTVPKRVTASAEDALMLNVSFVNVGQGDCTIIELPDGKTMIIDGGEDDSDVKTAINTFIQNSLPQDFKYFDYCILTHADSDHCGSLDDVLIKYPARVSYRPNVEAVGTDKNPYTDPGANDLTVDAKTKDTAAYAKAIDAMYNIDGADFTPTVYVTDPDVSGQTIAGGTGDDAYTFTFYTPLSDKYTDWNNYSPIMILEYRGVKFAMSGDAEKENEKEFAEKTESAKTDGITDKYDVFDAEFCVNVVKAGHHGSRTSTSSAYLDAITTEAGAKTAYYVFSCGKDNKYGHPHEETITRLHGMGVPDANMLRTDVVGDICFTVKPDDAGEYKLFYGATAQQKPNTDTPSTPPDATDDEFTLPTWLIVVIVVVAVLVVVAIFVYGGKKHKKGRKGGRK